MRVPWFCRRPLVAVTVRERYSAEAPRTLTPVWVGDGGWLRLKR